MCVYPSLFKVLLLEIISTDTDVHTDRFVNRMANVSNNPYYTEALNFNSRFLFLSQIVNVQSWNNFVPFNLASSNCEIYKILKD